MEQAKEHFLESVPHVTAIFVRGSAARGEPGPYSDLDMILILNRRQVSPDDKHHSLTVPTHTRFFNGCLVTAEEMTRKSFQEDHLSKRDERFFWKIRALRESRILYDPTNLVKETVRKMNKNRRDPVAQAYVIGYYFNEVLEFVGKLRNALIARDAALAIYSARQVSWAAGEIIIALNRITPKSDNTFVREVLGVRLKPDSFKRDFLEGLGYGPRASNPSVVGKAAQNLASGIYLLLRRTFFAKARGDLRILLTAPEVENLLFTSH